MPLQTIDTYQHAGQFPGANFTTAATGTTGAGTVVPNAAGSGAGSSTSLISGATLNDTRGSYNVVTAGSPAPGVISVVNFANPYGVLPGCVLVQALDTTASPAAPVAVAASSITQTGFSVSTSATLTTAHTVAIQYEVIA